MDFREFVVASQEERKWLNAARTVKMVFLRGNSCYDKRNSSVPQRKADFRSVSEGEEDSDSSVVALAMAPYQFKPVGKLTSQRANRLSNEDTEEADED